jgi:alkylation response protein AidB-like acyl-CoA dehydrogenase
VPISNHQMVQKMLADMAMKTEAARWLVYSRRGRSTSGHRDTQDGGDGQVLRHGHGDGGRDRRRAGLRRLRLHGGLPDREVFRDAKILQIYEGTNQIQRFVIART